MKLLKLIFVITLCLSVCTWIFFLKDKIFNLVIMLDNDCTLKNKPILTNKSDSMSPGYLSVEITCFNNHSQIFSSFLEPYAIIILESRVIY